MHLLNLTMVYMRIWKLCYKNRAKDFPFAVLLFVFALIPRRFITSSKRTVWIIDRCIEGVSPFWCDNRFGALTDESKRH